MSMVRQQDKAHGIHKVFRVPAAQVGALVAFEGTRGMVQGCCTGCAADLVLAVTGRLFKDSERRERAGKNPA